MHDYYLEMLAFWETVGGHIVGEFAPESDSDPESDASDGGDATRRVHVPLGAPGARGAQGALDNTRRGHAKKPPSWSTFLARWRSVWRHVLRIRKSSQHAECNICFKYREELRFERKDFRRKIDIAKKWQHHLEWQYADRCVYWSLRWSSRGATGARGASSDVLCIIIDSLDRTKFALPKYNLARKSHKLDELVRPRVLVTGAIAHGWTSQMIISDETIVHGASYFIDVLSNLIQSVFAMSNGKLPKHLVVFIDNTVAQAKNNETTIFLAHLVSTYHFQTTNLFMLTEGHTHEDIGLSLINQLSSGCPTQSMCAGSLICMLS
jgi:hypothetical protein